MNDVIELDLTGMAYGGDSFGRDSEGRMVFVPFSLPGERVRVAIVEEHPRWARARLLEVLLPSLDRIRPRCKHFADCGGCHYQHMPYQAQLLAKEEVLKDQLRRIGGFERPPVHPSVPSPSPWNTRNHLQFKLTAGSRLGFNAAGSERIVPIDECHLPESALADLWPRIDLEGAEGISRVSVRAGIDEELMVIFEGEREPPFEMHVDAPVSVVWISEDRRATLAGDPILEMQVFDCPFVVSPGSFFQVNAAMAGELVQRTLEALDVQPGTTIFDLYAGVGLFSVFLAQVGAHIVAVEDSASACADFEVNLEAFEDIQLYEAPVEMALPQIPEQPEAVVVDPPRAGLSREALDGILARRAPQLIYISCDAATFARDAARLNAAGYYMLQATPIDLFPQTYHIEIFSHWRDGSSEIAVD
jgi:23S rRNA (uracil1939-C5)-methyltransferase